MVRTGLGGGDAGGGGLIGVLMIFLRKEVAYPLVLVGRFGDLGETRWNTPGGDHSTGRRDPAGRVALGRGLPAQCGRSEMRPCL